MLAQYCVCLQNMLPGGAERKAGPRVAGLPDAADADAAIRYTCLMSCVWGGGGGEVSIRLPSHGMDFVAA